MFTDTFYHGTLRKYVTLFGTLFNDIYVNRTDAVGGVINTIKVPLAYGPKEKALARLMANPNLDLPAGIVVPRMGFEITTLSYSPTRKLPSIGRNRHVNASDPTKMLYNYNPVPYDISFSLHIVSKLQDDGAQIIEQILPYFTPERTTTVNLIPEMEYVVDIPLTLINVTPSDTYEGGFEERRAITWTLDFLMKAYFYGPVKQAGVITLANINYFDVSGYDPIESAVGSATAATPDSCNITPGQYANGAPTSNSSLSVDRNLIAANSNYGYIVTSG
jgi:hypothetical protein